MVSAPQLASPAPGLRPAHFAKLPDEICDRIFAYVARDLDDAAMVQAERRCGDPDAAQLAAFRANNRFFLRAASAGDLRSWQRKLSHQCTLPAALGRRPADWLPPATVSRNALLDAAIAQAPVVHCTFTGAHEGPRKAATLEQVRQQVWLTYLQEANVPPTALCFDDLLPRSVLQQLQTGPALNTLRGQACVDTADLALLDRVCQLRQVRRLSLSFKGDKGQRDRPAGDTAPRFLFFSEAFGASFYLQELHLEGSWLAAQPSIGKALSHRFPNLRHLSVNLGKQSTEVIADACRHPALRSLSLSFGARPVAEPWALVLRHSQVESLTMVGLPSRHWGSALQGTFPQVRRLRLQFLRDWFNARLAWQNADSPLWPQLVELLAGNPRIADVAFFEGDPSVRGPGVGWGPVPCWPEVQRRLAAQLQQIPVLQQPLQVERYDYNAHLFP